MGVKDLWNDFPQDSKRMTELASGFYRDQKRKPRVALDTPQWLVGIEQKSKSWGFNEHRQLLRRLVAFTTAGIDLVLVFDGTDRPHKIRHKTRVQREHPFVRCAQKMARGLGLPCIVAPGEAEAQCSYLQHIGEVDFVFSDDADVLVFGATSILSYSRETANESALTRSIRQIDVVTDRRSYLLRALLQGNDYDKGVARLGSKVASQIADMQTGFAQRLEDIFLSHGGDPVLLENWRQELTEELKTNKSKYLSRRCNVVLPDDFPKPEVLQALFCPTVLKDPSLAWKAPNKAALELIWLDVSPIQPSPQAVEALALRRQQMLYAETNETITTVKKVSARKRRTAESLEVQFEKCIAPALLAYHIFQKTDDPRWYESIKRLKDETVEVELSNHWPYGAPFKVNITDMALSLSKYVVRAEKRKNHLVTDMFARAEKRGVGFELLPTNKAPKLAMKSNTVC